HPRGAARGRRPVRGPVPDPVQEPGKPRALFRTDAWPRPVALLVPEATQFLARDLLDVGQLAVGQRAPPLVVLELGAPGRRGDRGGDLRAGELAEHRRGRARAAGDVLVAERLELVVRQRAA